MADIIDLGIKIKRCVDLITSAQSKDCFNCRRGVCGGKSTFWLQFLCSYKKKEIYLLRCFFLMSWNEYEVAKMVSVYTQLNKKYIMRRLYSNFFFDIMINKRVIYPNITEDDIFIIVMVVDHLCMEVFLCTNKSHIDIWIELDVFAYSWILPLI